MAFPSGILGLQASKLNDHRSASPIESTANQSAMFHRMLSYVRNVARDSRATSLMNGTQKVHLVFIPDFCNGCQ
jgi:hypothetical protein